MSIYLHIYIYLYVPDCGRLCSPTKEAVHRDGRAECLGQRLRVNGRGQLRIDLEPDAATREIPLFESLPEGVVWMWICLPARDPPLHTQEG